MHKRKQAVLLTALRLFSKKGFTDTSIQDILNEANISKGTFYNYFSSKNECLIAILEYGRDEVEIRRRELLVGQDTSSKQILTKQIAIRLEVNREHNLFPIFQAVFHSGDSSLKAFINKHQMKDLAWLANRLVDVYGKPVVPFAPDLAVILHGIVNHLIQAWRTVEPNKGLDVAELVHFAMRRLDSIAQNMIETNDMFLGDKLFAYEDVNTKHKKVTTEQLLEKLLAFNITLDDDQKSGKQFCQFLINEIQSVGARVYLLETVIRSFRKAFIGTTHEAQAREIVAHIWSYIDTIKKEI